MTGAESGEATAHDLPKTWAIVSRDEIILEADTKRELHVKMRNTDLPAHYEKVALPEPHGSVIV